MYQTPSRPGNPWRYVLVVPCCLLALGFWHNHHTTQASETPQRSLQASMQEIFQALTHVFPLSLNTAQFTAPENRQTIRTALQALSTQAAHMAQHGQGGPERFDFLRRALVTDAQEALRRFDLGEYQEAEFVVHQLTENCFACHSKLPPPRHSLLGQQFIASAHIAALPLKTQARLAVATRQFDTALERYETLFKTPTMSAGDIDLTGAFEDYLKVAIRVQDDVMRPIITLQTFLQRTDVPAFLRQQVSDWLASFRGLESPHPSGDALARARKLIREGQGRNRFPADRRGLVHFVVASGLLHRYLEVEPSDPGRIAEAYYLLGITETYVSRSLWHAETEFFLETAIRAAPTSSHARQAYAFLEDYLITRYTGSSGLHLPPEAEQYLRELRQLIQE